MPSISAGSSASVSVDFDTTVTTDGNGRFVFAPTSGSSGEGYLTGRQVVGPFKKAGTLTITAQTLMNYTVSNDSTVDNKVVSVTASRDAVVSDAGNMLNCNSGSAVVLTIQSDASSGWTADETIGLYQAGAGAASFAAGGGVTLRGTAPTISQYGTMGIMRVGANEWAYL